MPIIGYTKAKIDSLLDGISTTVANKVNNSTFTSALNGKQNAASLGADAAAAPEVKAASVAAVAAANINFAGALDFTNATVSGLDLGQPNLTAEDYLYLRGVNTQGGGGSNEEAARVPGTLNVDYFYNSQGFYNYIASRGHKIVRVDFLWERVQPVMGGALDATKLAELTAAVQRAANANLYVLLDMKNYGRRFLANDTQVMFGSGITSAQFADVWSRLATAFSAQPAVVAYGIMNEPHDLPGANTWKTFSQAAVTAIRATGDTRAIFVAGDAYSGLWNWSAVNGSPWITDPANNTVYEGHLYFDHDRSGRYLGTYASDAAADVSGGWSGGISQRVTSDLNNFIGWLQTNGVRGFIGEIGWPGDESPTQWNALGQLAYGMLNTAGIGATYWSTGETLSDTAKAGSWYSQDAYHRGTQTPQPQTAVIEATANLSKVDPAAGTGLGDSDIAALVLATGTATGAAVRSIAPTSSAVSTHPLPRWAAKLSTSPSTAKIAILGDSTSSAGFQEVGQLKTQLTDVHILTDADLAGIDAANIVMYGIPGHEAAGYWAESSVGGPVTAFNPDVIVYSMGINDVRYGNSLATLITRLTTELDTIRAALPNADLVLRIPNSITTDGGDGSISAAQAQTFTDMLRNAYLRIAGRYTNCRVFNAQDSIFGRRSTTLAGTRGLMYDQIHPAGPGVRAIADGLVAELLGKRAAYSGASAVSNSAPATVSAPTALTLTAVPGDGQVVISASGGTGATSYALYRSSTVTGTPIATSFPFTDTGRTNGTAVTYIATATNAGGTVTSPAVTATPAASGPTVLAVDNFNRTDNTTSLGTAPTGGTWQTKGTWGIQSNSARYLATGSATGSFRHATLDVGAADVTVQASVAITAGEQGICFRMTDAENYLLMRMGGNANGNYELFRIQGGSGSQLTSVAATGSPTAPYLLKVVLSGSTITPYVNGVAQTPITSTFNQTATRHGLWAAGNGTGNAYEDLLITT
jgi:endoglucanase